MKYKSLLMSACVMIFLFQQSLADDHSLREWWSSNRSCPNEPAYAILEYGRWDNGHTIEYYLNADFLPSNLNRINAMLAAEMRMNGVMDTQVGLSYQGRTLDPLNNTVQFENLSNASGITQALYHWDDEKKETFLDWFKIRIDDNFSNNLVCRYVMMHEFGHALGLAHVDDPLEVMHGEFDFNLELGMGDQAGLQILYPENNVPPVVRARILDFQGNNMTYSGQIATVKKRPGVAELDVIFDASNSSDVDGMITDYYFEYGNINFDEFIVTHQSQIAHTYTVDEDLKVPVRKMLLSKARDDGCSIDFHSNTRNFVNSWLDIAGPDLQPPETPVNMTVVAQVTHVHINFDVPPPATWIPDMAPFRSRVYRRHKQDAEFTEIPVTIGYSGGYDFDVESGQTYIYAVKLEWESFPDFQTPLVISDPVTVP